MHTVRTGGNRMSNVDLSALHIDEQTPAVPKQPWGPRLLVLGLCALIITVAATFLVPIVWPPRAVRMAAISLAATIGQESKSTSTEAVGWVEADPFPVIVRPLVNGHVEWINVLEGAVVHAHETVIATLISADLMAADERARAALAESRTLEERAKANHLLAVERLAQNAEALLRVQSAETQLSAINTKLFAAKAHDQELAALATSASAHLKAQMRLRDAGQSYPVALERARAEADAAKANIQANKVTIEGLLKEQTAQTNQLELCKQLAADPVDLRGAAAIANAELSTANAVAEKAWVDLNIAKRELEWANVRSPIDGIVLRLEAQPGDMVGHGEKGILALYDPKKLRARIDVPIDSLRGIRPGQEVEVTSEAIGNQVVKGTVQRFQHETDLLKNTLQVKIGLVDPPALLRPETLCRARFLTTNPEGEPKTISAFRVPTAAVQGNLIYVFDPKRSTARAINIEVLRADGDESIVRGDLSPTQRVVIELVADGEAIREQTL
jgi:HlyD family secretion protein